MAMCTKRLQCCMLQKRVEMVHECTGPVTRGNVTEHCICALYKNFHYYYYEYTPFQSHETVIAY